MRCPIDMRTDDGILVAIDWYLGEDMHDDAEALRAFSDRKVNNCLLEGIVYWRYLHVAATAGIEVIKAQPLARFLYASELSILGMVEMRQFYEIHLFPDEAPVQCFPERLDLGHLSKLVIHSGYDYEARYSRLMIALHQRGKIPLDRIEIRK